METRFNEVSRDWANWFVISRVSCIKNLVITNLLENNQSVRYIGVELIINRSNKRERERRQSRLDFTIVAESYCTCAP